MLYWSVLFFRSGKPFLQACVTDGDAAPHTESSIRKMIEIRHGAFEALAAVGPFASVSEARAHNRSVQRYRELFDVLSALAV